MSRGFLYSTIIFLGFFLNACQKEASVKEIQDALDLSEETMHEIQDFEIPNFSVEQERTDELIEVLSIHFAAFEGQSLKTLVGLSNVQKALKKLKKQQGSSESIEKDMEANLKAAEEKPQNNLKQLEQELKFSIAQLKALKTDVEGHLISEEESQKFLAIEQEALNRIVEQFTGIKASTIYLQDHFSRLIPEGEQLVDSIKNVKP